MSKVAHDRCRRSNRSRHPAGRGARLTIAAAGVLAAVVGATVGLLSTSTPEADAHGSTQAPPSRIYACRFTEPSNSLCRAAQEADPQAIYDWMEVNIGDASGRHEELIPDGQLCSAGREKYAAFDEPGAWPLTHLTPDQAGEHEIVFQNTAPHATEYYRLYLTEPGFDARTDRLGWDDLDLVHDSGPMAASSEARFAVELPERDVPAVLYVVWQRSDSPEAFYACSDVTVSGEPASGDSTPTTSTPTTSTPTTGAPPEGDAGDHDDDGHDHSDADAGDGDDHTTPPASAVSGDPSLTG